MTPPLPNKRYQIIYADPPWEYATTMVNPNRKRLSLSNAANHYPTMSIDELCQLPISEIADEDCLLFMWIGSPMLDDSMKVGKAWGFKYTTVGFIWDKKRTNPGYYTMSQGELCLIFKKGKIPRPRGARNIRQFYSGKRGEHSQKPSAIRERINKMFPTQDKIELFARRPNSLLADKSFDDWDLWGLEVNEEI